MVWPMELAMVQAIVRFAPASGALGGGALSVWLGAQILSVRT